MTVSLQKKVPCMMTLSLAMITMIAPADAQITTCTSTSPQCCWVVQIWQLMGKTTSVSATNATACCSYISGVTTYPPGIPMVTCTSRGMVTGINWKNMSLTGSIPSSFENLRNLRTLWLNNNLLSGCIPASLGNLVYLRTLFLSNNQLSGEIPSSLGGLTSLQNLLLANNQLSGVVPSSLGYLDLLINFYVQNNAGINGTFTPLCHTAFEATNTELIICGCRATVTPPTNDFPPPELPDACLASGTSSALTLEKRILTFSHVDGRYKYTCNTDEKKNPYADCLNTIAKICNSFASSFNKTLCQTGVNDMVKQMSPWWQNVRRECGQWRWIDQFNGSYTSSRCATANSDLIANAYYTVWNPDELVYDTVRVTSYLTNSIIQRLWSKTALWG